MKEEKRQSEKLGKNENNDNEKKRNNEKIPKTFLKIRGCYLPEI